MKNKSKKKTAGVMVKKKGLQARTSSVFTEEVEAIPQPPATQGKAASSNTL